MAKLKVYVKNNQTEVKVPVGIRLLIRRCCQAVLTTENFGRDAEVSVSFVSNNEIKNLNKIYREKDSVTDVLSYPQFEGHDDLLEDLLDDETETLIGDVVICFEQAERQAEEYGTGLTREMLYLFVHSVMHLFGYDHMEEDEKAVMRAREEEVLSAIGVKRKK